jgi:hypothetical protein
VPEHPLVEFVYSTFGEPLGALLLVGYASEAEKQASFKFRASKGGATRTWIVDVTARSLPCGREPLVLAALLKFLVLRVDLDEPSYVSRSFEFNMRELLEEVARDGTRMSEEEADEIIEKYAGLSYTLREWEPKGPKAFTRARARGYYTFLSGYTTLKYRDEGDTRARRLVDRITFCEDFVEGLKRGEITFAGMKLGQRQPDRSPPFFPFGRSV